MKKINEIFYSLQGEGRHTGVPSVFVRFCGCNLKCDFCDTRHEQGRGMTDDEIIAEINRYPAKRIVLTGGEPSLFIYSDFILDLKEKTGKEIAIETNGTKKIPEEVDWVTVSPKFGFIGGSSSPVDIIVDKADEIKVVDLGQPLEPYLNLPCVNDTTHFYLQPCYVEDPEKYKGNINSTVNRILADPRWKLSFQLHRALGIR